MRQMFKIPCKIERGGFSGERTFEIEIKGRKLLGTAFVKYLRTTDDRELDDATPGQDESIDGFVMCRVIRKSDEGTVVIDLPSDDVMEVSEEILQEV